MPGPSNPSPLNNQLIGEVMRDLGEDSRLEAPPEGAAHGLADVMDFPGLGSFRAQVVSFLVARVVDEGGEALRENREGIVKYISEKAAELTGYAFDGAQHLLEQVRGHLEGK